MMRKRILSALLALILCFSTFISVAAVTLEPVLTPLLQDNARIAEKLATEGAVLLENNDNALPIAKPGEGAVALFGFAAARTFRIGGGSGDPWTGGVNAGGNPLLDTMPLWHVNIYDAFKNAGYDVPTADMMETIGKQLDATLPATMAWNSTFYFPEPVLTADYVQSIAQKTDTAVYVIGRCSAEGADRSLTARTVSPAVRTEAVPGPFEVGDYNLLPKEVENLRLLGANFDKVIVVVNGPGPIDTKFFKEIPGLDALVYAGFTGEEGGLALMKLLNGTENFSGKLIETWAKNYTDYPASATFANNDNNGNDERYVEDIYVGYRYFDTANITPAYAFGYGLSYTNFNIDVTNVTADANTVKTFVKVTNTGNYAGKEVVQVYYSAPDSAEADKEYQELAVYAKTDLLAPGDSQYMVLSYNTTDMTYYNTTNAANVLDPGNYMIRVGDSSRNTKVAAVLNINEKVITEQLTNLMHVPMNILEQYQAVWTKSNKGWTPYTYAGEAAEIAAAKTIAIDPKAFTTVNNACDNDNSVTTYTTDPTYVGQPRSYQNSSVAPSSTTLGFTGSMVNYDEKVVVYPKENIKLIDVYKGTKTLEQLVAQMSNLELAQLNVSTGQAPYEGFMTFNDPTKFDSVRGCATGSTDLLQEKYGIPLVLVNDGPGGLRVTDSVTAYDAANNYQPTKVYNFSTSWPSSATRAASWNLDLLKEFGVGMGKEMTSMGISVLLGTSLNIHRDPLCGRNFEYYSEDPVVNGDSVVAITLGLQSNPGITACLKHFAANNQETRRNGGNSVMTERALREIYLKGFEIGVKDSQAGAIMTSYNRINNVPAADDYNLMEYIVRDEWGFGGYIMTDWGGGSSTPAKSMHAGNDMISPGGNSQVFAVLRNVDPNPIFKANGEIDEILSFSSASITKTFATVGSTLSTTGANVARAHLGEGYTAAYSAAPTTEGGSIYYIEVNGQRIARTVSYTPYTGPRAGAEAGVGRTVTNYLTSDYATIEDGGKTLAYKVNYAALQANICRGDLQKSAIHNLKAFMYSVNAKKYYEGNPDVNIGSWSSMYNLEEHSNVEKSAVDSCSVTSSTATAITNEDIVINLSASPDVIGFFLNNESGKSVTITSATKTAGSDGRNDWVIKTKVGTAGSRILSLIPVSETRGVMDAVEIPVTVTNPSNAYDVISAAFTVKATKVNTPVNVQIITGERVSKVAIQNTSGTTMGKTLVSKTVNANRTITWVYSISIGTAGMERSFNVLAGNASGVYESSKTISIAVVK